MPVTFTGDREDTEGADRELGEKDPGQAVGRGVEVELGEAELGDVPDVRLAKPDGRADGGEDSGGEGEVGGPDGQQFAEFAACHV